VAFLEKTLIFAGLLAVVVRPALALASDLGPSTAVATIRHDLPLLLAAPFQDMDLHTKPTVDWVVTNGQSAVASWHAEQRRGIVNLVLRSGHWWWRASAVKTAYNAQAPWTRMQMPGTDLEVCDSATFPDPPSANTLLEEGFIDEALAHELSSRLPAVHTSDLRGGSSCTLDDQYLVSTTGGSEATFFHHEEYLTSWFTWTGRTAAYQNEETGPSLKARYSFTVTASRNNTEGGMQRLVHSIYKPLFDELLPTPPPALTFRRNSTIDLWLPYVISKQDRYVLSITNVTPEITSVPGTVQNNVLHFVLPAFTLGWGDVARGEIDAGSVEPPVRPTG
jgi:hypothetical protein